MTDARWGCNRTPHVMPPYILRTTSACVCSCKSTSLSALLLFVLKLIIGVCFVPLCIPDDESGIKLNIEEAEAYRLTIEVGICIYLTFFGGSGDAWQ